MSAIMTFTPMQIATWGTGLFMPVTTMPAGVPNSATTDVTSWAPTNHPEMAAWQEHFETNGMRNNPVVARPEIPTSTNVAPVTPFTKLVPAIQAAGIIMASTGCAVDERTECIINNVVGGFLFLHIMICAVVAGCYYVVDGNCDN